MDNQMWSTDCILGFDQLENDYKKLMVLTAEILIRVSDKGVLRGPILWSMHLLPVSSDLWSALWLPGGCSSRLKNSHDWMHWRMGWRIQEDEPNNPLDISCWMPMLCSWNSLLNMHAHLEIGFTSQYIQHFSQIFAQSIWKGCASIRCQLSSPYWGQRHSIRQSIRAAIGFRKILIFILRVTCEQDCGLIIWAMNWKHTHWKRESTVS